MRKRNILLIVGVVILIPVLGAAWWFLSPLFISQNVDEEFPFAAQAQLPPEMTMAEAEAVMSAMAGMDQPPVAEPMPTMSPAMPPAAMAQGENEVRVEVVREGGVEVYMVPETMIEEVIAEPAVSTPAPVAAPAGPEIVASGNFRDVDSFHRGSGVATIYRAPDGSSLLRLEDFRVTNGPELHVLLAQAPDPQSREELDSGGYVGLGRLKGNIGNQNYEIPPDLDPTAQNSVIIYCRPFRVIFSVAPLQRAG